MIKSIKPVIIVTQQHNSNKIIVVMMMMSNMGNEMPKRTQVNRELWNSTNIG